MPLALPLVLVSTLLAFACGPRVDVTPIPEPTPQPEPDATHVQVAVTLDGEPVEGAHVMQGGSETRVTTDVLGVASVRLDAAIVGDRFVLASHPAARTGSAEIVQTDVEAPLAITLFRIAAEDNLEYVFADPGTPKDRDNSSQCGHCHFGANDTWDGSAHQQSASRQTLWDTYLGRAHHNTESDCTAAGGTFDNGACRVHGVLSSLNADCSDPTDAACGVDAVNSGRCADCHAPGIDGELGGRDLRAAAGRSLSYGLHCDVCHLVESVSLDDERPGVGGALRIHRPIEPSPSDALGMWLPLSFGPFDDVPTVKMGAVARPHFRDGTLCAGCHQYDQIALSDNLMPDAVRWPSLRLPVHSTYAEWQEGPYADVASCQSCHMPPLPEYWNSAGLAPDSITSPGVAQGWRRAPGAVRAHRFEGPLDEGSEFLRLAAHISIATSLDADVFRATVETTNVGAGHGLPTGEPGRQVVLVVEAECDGQALRPIGGDAIGALGGHRAMKTADEDWTQWPEAMVGDTIRVIAIEDVSLDYAGYGPFAPAGRFAPDEKGLRAEVVVGVAVVTGLSGDGLGTITLDAPLPDGDIAYLTREPEPGDPAGFAGAPGALFARVTADAEGRRGVPHFLAVDIVSDRRLRPFEPVVTRHAFAPLCAAPTVRATLWYRRAPFDEQRLRDWHFADRVMAEASR